MKHCKGCTKSNIAGNSLYENRMHTIGTFEHHESVTPKQTTGEWDWKTEFQAAFLCITNPITWKNGKPVFFNMVFVTVYNALEAVVEYILKRERTHLLDELEEKLPKKRKLYPNELSGQMMLRQGYNQALSDILTLVSKMRRK